MSENKAASRYAKSLIDLSNEQNAFEVIKGDMVMLAKVIDENSELEAILNNPIIPLDKKAGILKDVFGSSVQPLTNTFIKLVVIQPY
jgi:F-type H+-transporting ATPase subunit delta